MTAAMQSRGPRRGDTRAVLRRRFRSGSQSAEKWGATIAGCMAAEVRVRVERAVAGIVADLPRKINAAVRDALAGAFAGKDGEG